jgi:SAM-dependent methyltransferase
VRPLERVHRFWIAERRVLRLAELVKPLLPSGAHVLDVGCGDGRLARRILDERPDLRLEGMDVLVRGGAAIPVSAFDGQHIPRPDQDVDVVLLVDVLHHAASPLALLREAARVSRRAVVVKDHVVRTPLDHWQLRLMDDVGNRRFGVALPHDYWTWDRWQAAWGQLGLRAGALERDLRLYPGPLDRLFGRGLHLLARLESARAESAPAER